MHTFYFLGCFIWLDVSSALVVDEHVVPLLSLFFMAVVLRRVSSRRRAIVSASWVFSRLLPVGEECVLYVVTVHRCDFMGLAVSLTSLLLLRVTHWLLPPVAARGPPTRPFFAFGQFAMRGGGSAVSAKGFNVVRFTFWGLPAEGAYYLTALLANAAASALFSWSDGAMFS